MRFATKKAFTMMELVVVMFLITTGFFSIILMLNSGMKFTQIIRTKMVALNLAREGLESVYQMRDTNRYRWSSKRDLCRLKTNPLVDETIPGCEDDSWLMSGNYIVVSTGDEQKYFVAIPMVDTGMNIKDGLQPSDLNYSICFAAGEWYACPGINYTGYEGRYYREIRGLGLFLKDSLTPGGDFVDCPRGEETVLGKNCGDSDPKEYRFCSKVEYYNGNGVSDVEICSLLTNFLE